MKLNDNFEQEPDHPSKPWSTIIVMAVVLGSALLLWLLGVI